MTTQSSRAASRNFFLIVLILSVYRPATSDRLTELEPIPKPRVLVITESLLEETHKKLLSTLEKASTQLTKVTSDNTTIPLVSNGEYIYDAIVFLAPSAVLSSPLPIRTVKSFLADGKTIFLTASASPSGYTSSLAAAIGIDLVRKPLIDHVGVFSELDDGTHTYVHAGGSVASERLLGSAVNSPGDIAFHGPGATLLKDNELVRPIIWGSPSCYTYDSHTAGAPRVAGSAAVLAAAISTRTGGRASYFGSLSAMSDRTLDVAGERHHDAVTSFLRWTLGAYGMLHVGDIKHWGLGPERAIDSAYRVGDGVAVSLDVFEWQMAQKKWMPFRADDMQVEFTMLNPYVRTRLKDLGNGTFTTTITAPNQIGVYKFVVEYNRPGVAQISELKIVPVRPLLHSEYERFIAMATPYYFASFSMLIAVVLLGIVLMFGPDLSEPQHEKEA